MRMRLAAAIRRGEAWLLGSLLVIALILAALMTWRTLSAERRHRLAAERIMSELAAIVGEEIARRTIFEYEQFGFSLLRPLLARGLRDGAYQQRSYYAGEWKPEYEELIGAAAGWTRHPDYPRVAWNAALTADMIVTQPVVHEFPQVKVPTLLIIGLRAPPISIASMSRLVNDTRALSAVLNETAHHCRWIPPRASQG